MADRCLYNLWSVSDITHVMFQCSSSTIIILNVETCEQTRKISLNNITRESTYDHLNNEIFRLELQGNIQLEYNLNSGKVFRRTNKSEPPRLCIPMRSRWIRESLSFIWWLYQRFIRKQQRIPMMSAPAITRIWFCITLNRNFDLSRSNLWEELLNSYLVNSIQQNSFNTFDFIMVPKTLGK